MVIRDQWETDIPLGEGYSSTDKLTNAATMSKSTCISRSNYTHKKYPCMIDM